MPHLRTYHVFISHSWDYSEPYKTVKSWLDETPLFCWADYSVPISNPLDTKSNVELQHKIRQKISLCSCVVILSGMYVAYSKWIDYEINAAIELNKPIIGVRPWGQERVPLMVQNNATVMIGWNSSSLVQAIRDYAI